MGFNSALVFPLQGVSVEAVDPVFQAKMLDMLKQTGRSETTCALCKNRFRCVQWCTTVLWLLCWSVNREAMGSNLRGHGFKPERALVQIREVVGSNPRGCGFKCKSVGRLCRLMA